MKRIFLPIFPIVAIRPIELLSVERGGECRIQKLVLQLKFPIRIFSRSRSDLLLAFEEKSSRLRSVRRDLKPERNFCLTGNDRRVPHTIDLGLRRKRHREEQN